MTGGHAITAGTTTRPLRALLELHYCVGAFSGIGQETRLILQSLSGGDALTLGGIINPQAGLSGARLAPSPRHEVIPDVATQVRIVSEIDRIVSGLRPKRDRWAKIKSSLSKSLYGELARKIHRRRFADPLVRLDASLHGDLLWERLFSSTLAPEDRHRVLECALYAIATGRREANGAYGDHAWSARIDTTGWDLLISQTPFPYRVAAGTRLVVRYHDAIPIFYPHTISEGEAEALRHLRVLGQNAREGAYFACDSEPVRQDLLRLVPEIGDRAEVIPVMVSDQYRARPFETSVIEQILRQRACPPSAMAPSGRGTKTPAAVVPGADGADVEGGAIPPSFAAGRFFLAVSTLEPRKNFGLLIDAWGRLRREHPETPALVLVAGPGWRYADDADAIARWRGQGLFHLWRVPTEELCLLYSAAHAVICPSKAEGFDLSGIEAMLCGAPVLASDIPVHRWVYGDAATYFDPFDATDLARRLAEVAHSDRRDSKLADMRARGQRQAALYHPDVVARQWVAFLERVNRSPAA